MQSNTLLNNYHILCTCPVSPKNTKSQTLHGILQLTPVTGKAEDTCTKYSLHLS